MLVIECWRPIGRLVVLDLARRASRGEHLVVGRTEAKVAPTSYLVHVARDSSWSYNGINTTHLDESTRHAPVAIDCSGHCEKAQEGLA